MYHCLSDNEGRKWEKCVQQSLIKEGKSNENTPSELPISNLKKTNSIKLQIKPKHIK